jgi:hypothetical protein
MIIEVVGPISIGKLIKDLLQILLALAGLLSGTYVLPFDTVSTSIINPIN